VVEIACCRKPPLEIYTLGVRPILTGGSVIRSGCLCHEKLDREGSLPFRILSLTLLPFTIILLLFTSFTQPVLALDVTLAWDPNEEEVAGYRLYYGRESGNYSTMIDVREDERCRVMDLEDRRKYFFVVTAYDSNNRESLPSEEIDYPYNAPINLLINSGFESGSLDGWNLAKGIVAVNGQAASSSSYGIKMYDKGSVEQTFSTIKGRTYYVSARMRIDRQTKKSSSGGLAIRVQNTKGGTLAKSPIIKLKNTSIGSWTEIHFSFTAKSDSTRLSFRNTGNFEVSADEFIVNPVSF
jgi:hypothetical protein